MTTMPTIHPKDCMCAACAGWRESQFGSQNLPGMRQFDTGATRSPDGARYDPEGFLSPLVIERFATYMNKHRVQADGSVRDSDNWQKGLPRETYIKGLWRHFLHLWTRHRGSVPTDAGAAASVEEDCCAIMFNVMGYLHETLKIKSDPPG